MRVRLTTEPDNRLALESPYDRGFVDDLKARIPWDGRTWEPARKRWLLSRLYLPDFLAYCEERQIEVLDDSQPAEAPVMALPPMPEELREAFDVLYLAYTAPIVVAEASYRALAKIFHSDRPDFGDAEKMASLNEAIATIRFFLTPPAGSPDGVEDDIPF